MPGTAEHLKLPVPPTTALSSRCGLALVVCLFAFTIARADDLPSQIAVANKLMLDGKPVDALALYSAAADKAGARAPLELAFNRACAQLAVGQVAEAEKALRDVLARAPTAELRAAAAFNLGSLESQRADAQHEQAPKDAIDSLRRAERLFRTASSELPDPAAATNIDLLQRRTATLLDRQKKEEEQKQDKSGKGSKDNKSPDSKPSDKKDGQQGKPDDKSQQPNPDDKNLSDDLNKLADQQDQQTKKSNDLTKQSEQGAPKEQQDQQQKQAADQQKNLRDKTEQAKKQAESKSTAAPDQQQKDAMSQAKDKLDKAEKAQQQAEEKLKQGDTKSAEQLQKDAAQQLRDAAQQAKSAEDAKKQQDQLKEQQEQAAQQQQEGDKDQSKPFDATAAQILDQERREKAMRDRVARQRIRPAPVSKDW